MQVRWVIAFPFVLSPLSWLPFPSRKLTFYQAILLSSLPLLIDLFLLRLSSQSSALVQTPVPLPSSTSTFQWSCFNVSEWTKLHNSLAIAISIHRTRNKTIETNSTTTNKPHSTFPWHIPKSTLSCAHLAFPHFSIAHPWSRLPPEKHHVTTHLTASSTFSIRLQLPFSITSRSREDFYTRLAFQRHN